MILRKVICALFVLCATPVWATSLLTARWVDITCALQTQMAAGNTISYATMAIDSCVVYGTAGDDAGTDLRLGKASAKTRPGRKTGELADSLKPLWKYMVSYNSTQFPTGGYGMGLSATFYVHVVNDTTTKFELPGLLNFDAHVLVADTVGTLGSSERNLIATTTDATMTASHGSGSWTTGSGGLDSAGISRIIGRKVWGVAAGLGGDSTTAAVRGVNMKLVDDATAPAPVIEEIFDDDGTGGRMDLSQLRIIAQSTGAVSADTGVIIYGADNGPAVAMVGSGTGAGLRLRGGLTSGAGMSVVAANAPGIADTSLNGDAMTLVAGTSGSGLSATGAGAGAGITATGGATNANGIRAAGTGTTGNGVSAQGGTTGNGIQAVGGATSGRGLNVSAPGNDWGAVFTGAGSGGGGILAQGTGTSGTGLRATGTASASARGMVIDSGLQITDASTTYEVANLAATSDVSTLATLANQQQQMAFDGMSVSGYADSIIQYYYPMDGSGNKDSVVFLRWYGGVATRIGAWIYLAPNDSTVVDVLRGHP